MSYIYYADLMLANNNSREGSTIFVYDGSVLVFIFHNETHGNPRKPNSQLDLIENNTEIQQGW